MFQIKVLHVMSLNRLKIDMVLCYGRVARQSSFHLSCLMLTAVGFPPVGMLCWLLSVFPLLKGINI